MSHIVFITLARSMTSFTEEECQVLRCYVNCIANTASKQQGWDLSESTLVFKFYNMFILPVRIHTALIFTSQAWWYDSVTRKYGEQGLAHG